MRKRCFHNDEIVAIEELFENLRAVQPPFISSASINGVLLHIAQMGL